MEILQKHKKSIIQEIILCIIICINIIRALAVVASFLKDLHFNKI